MTKVELQEALSLFINEPSNVHVEMYLLYEDEDGFKTYRPELEEGHLQPAMKTSLVNQIQNRFFGGDVDNDYELVHVNTSEASLNRQIFQISYDDIPKADEIFGAVINDTAEAFTSEQELSKMWGYIYKVSNTEKSIYLFKKNYPVNVVKKSSVYALFFSNNSLQLIDRDFLKLSKTFDIMLVDEELIILNRTEFEKYFEYIEAMQASAEEKIQAISDSNLIHDLSKITALSLKNNTLRKLLNINTAHPLLDKTPMQIAKLAKKYKVEFEITEDTRLLSLTSRKSAVAFIDFLNDNYQLCEFTKYKYKIKGKKKIQ